MENYLIFRLWVCDLKILGLGERWCAPFLGEIPQTALAPEGFLFIFYRIAPGIQSFFANWTTCLGSPSQLPNSLEFKVFARRRLLA